MQLDKIRLSRSGPKLTDSAEKKLEEVVGGTVPLPYLEFLRHVNGGTSTGYCFKLKGSQELQYVNTFLSSSSTSGKLGPMTIEKVLKNVKGFIPENTFPIAFVNGDDLLIVRLAGRKKGSIQLKINANVKDANDPESGIVSVAASFSSFVKMLEYKSEEELDDDDYGLY